MTPKKEYQEFSMAHCVSWKKYCTRLKGTKFIGFRWSSFSALYTIANVKKIIIMGKMEKLMMKNSKTGWSGFSFFMFLPFLCLFGRLVAVETHPKFHLSKKQEDIVAGKSLILLFTLFTQVQFAPYWSFEETVANTLILHTLLFLLSEIFLRTILPHIDSYFILCLRSNTARFYTNKIKP